MSCMKLKDDTEKWIVCRICLQQPSTGLESIFCLNNNQDLTLMILECGGVPIKKFDHYPDKICSKCLKHLQVAYVFRKTCQQSHKHLSNLIAGLDDEEQETIVFVEEDNSRELKLKFPAKNGGSGTETEMILDMSNVLSDDIEEFVPEDVRNKSREITSPVKIKESKSTSSMAKNNEKQIISHVEKNVKNLDLSIKLKEEIEDEEMEEFIREDTNGKDPVIYYKNTELKLQPQDNEKICENEMILVKMFQNDNEKLVEEDKTECLDELENEIFSKTSDEEYVPLTKKSSAHKKKVKRKDKTLKSSSERICKKQKSVILAKTIISAYTSDKESEKSSFNCNTCERTFTGSTALKRHQRNADGRKKYWSNFYKPIEEFALYSTHLNERPFNCDTCGLTFTRKASLDYHMRTHTGERPYKCMYCPASFAAKHTLKNHHRTHTNERPYDCDICGRSFKVKHGLARHIRTHTGERPYKCSFCPKIFADNDKRQKHHRSHTNDTNDHSHACDICDKSFPILYNLKRHKVEVHNIIDTESNISLKIYKCEICERSFVEKAHLRRHTKTHSSGERP